MDTNVGSDSLRDEAFSGRVHAFAATAARGSVESLRLAAVVADQAGQSAQRLEDVWQELCSGHYAIVDSFLTSSRCVFVLRRVQEPVALPPLRRRILESILSGAGQKVLSIDLGLAPSTIALHARAALQQIGIRERPGHVSPLLMLAAKAAREPATKTLARVSILVQGDETLWVVGAARPDAALTSIPPAEHAVVRRFIEGCAYDEIASERGRSVRTIANQLAATFRRLGVSGRCDLILTLYGFSVNTSMI